MDKTCNPDKLYERKHPRNSLPLSECKQCLFNILCNDYIIYEESQSQEKSESMAEKIPTIER